MGLILWDLAYQNHQCGCENKMLSIDSEYRRPVASNLEAPVCSCEVFVPFESYNVVTCVLAQEVIKSSLKSQLLVTN